MGHDKAGLDWHGRPLVAHVAASLAACVDRGPVLVVGPSADGATHVPGDRPAPAGDRCPSGGAPDWAAALPDGVELVADAVAHPGPVAALAAGLAALAGRAERALVAGTDQPWLTAATFAPLLRADGTAAWRADGHLQPLGAVYVVAPPPSDARRLRDLLAGAPILDADTATASSLRSLDTPAAYAAALR